MDENGALSYNDNLRHLALNKAFNSVYTIGVTNMSDLYNFFLGTQEEELKLKKLRWMRSYISKLNSNKSTGLDDLSLKVLKEVSCEVTFLLLRLFGKSLCAYGLEAGKCFSNI